MGSHHKVNFPIGMPMLKRHSTPIHQPGKRLWHGINLRFMQKKVSGGGHKSVSADLNLTSMIDYLVITVVFLLSNFGTAQQMASQEGLEVPTVPHADQVISAPIVAISSRAVLLDGRPVGDPNSVRGSTDRIDRLYERLRELRQNWGVTHPNDPFQGDIVFQIDRSIDWQLIRRVAATCAQAGYTNLNFAVNKGSSGAAPAAGAAAPAH